MVRVRKIRSIKYKYIERDHTHDTRKNITIRIFVYEVVYIRRTCIYSLRGQWSTKHYFSEFLSKTCIHNKKKI